MPAVSIPTSFQLAGRTWIVQAIDNLVDDDNQALLGVTIRHRAVIQISKEQSEECALHTFYHELIHAIVGTLGYEKLDKDEGKIDAISNMLLQFEQTRVDP